MTTTQVIIGIAAPVFTFLIGRYANSVSKTTFTNIEVARDYWKQQHLECWQRKKELEADLRHASEVINVSPRVMVVKNINPHHAADKEYIGVYPKNGIEPAHFTVEEYQKGVDRLKNNPEDNINNQTN